MIRRNGTASRLSIIVAVLVVVTYVSPSSVSAKPRSHTLYLHGYERFGEQELPEMPGWTMERLWKAMDAREPADDLPKSMFVTNAGRVAPNPSCSGNPYYPVWKGDVAGWLTDIEVTLHTLASPDSKIAVSIFRDLKTADCHRQDPTGGIVPYEYKPPIAVAVVDVPAGLGVTHVRFDGLPVEVYDHVILQIQIYDQGNHPDDQVRVLYDSPDYASTMTFNCRPTHCKG